MDYEYIRCGDYTIPDLKLAEETRSIGKWGRIHRDYLRDHHPIQFNLLALSGKFYNYLADLNEQAQDRMERIIEQIKVSEGVTERLKATDPFARTSRMNSIRNRAEEIVLKELICAEELV